MPGNELHIENITKDGKDGHNASEVLYSDERRELLRGISGSIIKKAWFTVSHLLMPLSYAAILGGMCTLVGTSTTLVVNDMLIDEQKLTSKNQIFVIKFFQVPV